jgi:hypothetical protein
MDRRILYKDPDELRMEIEKLISFEEKDGLLQLKQQLQEKTSSKPGPAKYARIMCCSFTSSNKEDDINKGAPAQHARLPQVN